MCFPEGLHFAIPSVGPGGRGRGRRREERRGMGVEMSGSEGGMG